MENGGQGEKLTREKRLENRNMPADDVIFALPMITSSGDAWLHVAVEWMCILRRTLGRTGDKI